MKKIFLKSLLVLIGVLITSLTTQVWATDGQRAVVYAICTDAELTANSAKTIKLNACYNNTSTPGDWHTIETALKKSSTEQKFYWDNKRLFVFDFTPTYDGLKMAQIQMYDGSTQKYTKHSFKDWDWIAESEYCYKLYTWGDGCDNCNSRDGWTNPYDSKLSMNTGHVYFDGTDWTGQSKIQLYVGHMTYQGFYTMNRVSHTNLYYVNPTLSWSDALHMGFIGNSSEYSSGDNTLWKIVQATKYTGGIKYGLQSNHTTLFSHGSNNGDMPSNLSDQSSSNYTFLNHNQTIKKVTCVNGTTFSEASVNSGTVTISAYKMSAHGTASNSNNSGTINVAGTTSLSKPAAYTGEVTVTASANEGYVFCGWYDAENEGTKLSSDASYTYNAPNSTKIVYARFAPKLPNGKRIYLRVADAIESTHHWYESSARFAAVFCNASSQDWVNCTQVTANSIYYVDVPSTGDYGFVIFCRMKNSSDAERVNKWDNRWNQTGDMCSYGTYNCVNITGWNTGAWRRYAPSPAIAGTMNDWDPTADQLSGSPLKKKLTLSAGTAYNFKIANGYDASWYGSGSTNDLTFVGQTTAETLSSGASDVMLLTADEGEYTFSWSGTALTVTYPVTTHPSDKYVYLRNTSWNSGSYCYLHHWYTSGSDYALTESSKDPKIKSKVTINGTSYYYFPILTTYPKFIAEAERGTVDDSKKTSNLTTASNQGKYVSKPSSSWTWSPFSFMVTLDEQHVVTTAPADPTVEFNGATLSGTLKPTWTGYDFGGYWSNSDCNETKVINADGSWVANAAGYTSSSKWIHTGGTATLYAKWTPVTLTSKATGNWNATATWNPACVPTIEHDVVITKAVTVNATDAKAKSVKIYNDGSSNTGKLTIGAGKALVVAEGIQKTTDGETYSATTAADLVLESDLSNGTGALIAGGRSTNTVATVQFATKARKNSSDKYVNQYFGIPFAATTKYSYYGAYLRKFDVATDKWVALGEDAMYPFTAYRIMREEKDEGETYVMDGVLRLPGITTNKDTTLTLSATYTDNMFANSWTAPIDITKFDAAADFIGAVATIYIFNAGSSDDYNSTPVQKGASAGNWNSLPVAAVMTVPDDYDLNVIPSQQAFLVQKTDGASHTLKLDYKKLVYDPAKESGASVIPTRAPKHAQETDLEIMRLNLAGDVSGFGDRVLMYMRDDFSAELDNGWEAYKLAGSDFAPQLCAYSQLGEMSISAIDDAEGTVLGFYAGTEDGNYTFSFGYEGDNVWYLNDHEAQKSALIDDNSTYQFTATPGTVAEHRFVISKAPIYTTPTGADEVVSGSKIRKQMINGTLYIIRDGRLYDVTGAFVK